METTAAARACWVLFFHLPLISGSSIPIGIGSNYSNLYEQSILPCKKEELQCGNGLCLLNWLRCQYKKDCGRDYMSIKLTCSKVHLNQSSPISEFPSYSENGNDPSLLVSPLLVAGVVIGLVLFLSCVTIIVGSLRKDGRLRQPHLRRDASYAPDGFSYSGSFGELRSTCMEEFPPAFDFGSYLETLSQVNIMYPDSPPWDEKRCMIFMRRSVTSSCSPLLCCAMMSVWGQEQHRYIFLQMIPPHILLWTLVKEMKYL
ncbi:protein BEAN1 isoform X2 [Struthio camelus]|uniref:protein BEAN1 isoform X2 n=1 Tax=Struthio camelus TaxID=8801 RepID=UPI003603DED9